MIFEKTEQPTYFGLIKDTNTGAPIHSTISAISAHPEMSHRVIISAENLGNRIRVLRTGYRMDRNLLRGPRLIKELDFVFFSPKNFQLARPCLSLRGDPA